MQVARQRVLHAQDSDVPIRDGDLLKGSSRKSTSMGD